MLRLLFDVEANGLDPDIIHCISVKQHKKDSVRRFTDMDEFRDYVKTLELAGPIRWFAHNGLGYDVKVVNKLVEPDLIRWEDVVDTSVASKLHNYTKFNTHSLKELGEYLGVFKGDYTGGWEVYTEEMGEYCDQDVLVLEAIVDYLWEFLTDKEFRKSLSIEHFMAWECSQMQETGFLFDVDEATKMLSEISTEVDELEASLEEAFPPKLVEVKRLKLRYKKDGTLFNNVQNAMDTYPKTEKDGAELVVYDWKKFNPGSPKERIDVLWESGWEPYDKTKGHIQKLKEGRTRR